MNTKQIGNFYEKKAISFLKEKGFSIIEQNFYAKKIGEIDIIATKNNIYHFIEVKSGKNFDPIYNVTPSKISKLIKSINYYLQKRKIDVYYSIDIVLFRDNNIEFIENISL